MDIVYVEQKNYPYGIVATKTMYCVVSADLMTCQPIKIVLTHEQRTSIRAANVSTETPNKMVDMS